MTVEKHLIQNLLIISNQGLVQESQSMWYPYSHTELLESRDQYSFGIALHNKALPSPNKVVHTLRQNQPHNAIQVLCAWNARQQGKYLFICLVIMMFIYHLIISLIFYRRSSALGNDPGLHYSQPNMGNLKVIHNAV